MGNLLSNLFNLHALVYIPAIDYYFSYRTGTTPPPPPLVLLSHHNFPPRRN